MGRLAAHRSRAMQAWLNAQRHWLVVERLPAYAPELNPVENVWQFMRENWLSNRVFTTYTDILDHCCDAWNKLIDQPWTIMSIGLRDWAHGC